MMTVRRTPTAVMAARVTGGAVADAKKPTSTAKARNAAARPRALRRSELASAPKLRRCASVSSPRRFASIVSG
jgi:hypothetical protein